MLSSQIPSQASQSDSGEKLFKGLLTERRIFPTPWHWCVHGFGIGQEVQGFEPGKAERLLDISLALSQKTKSDYHTFAHHLLHGIVSSCAGKFYGDEATQQHAHEQFTSALERLPNEAWQYARACALLTESLGKLGELDPYQSNILWHLKRAFEKVASLEVATDKLRYEKLQLFANLFLAAGQAGFSEMALEKQNGVTYIQIALQLSTTISDTFYRGRGSAILFSILALIGHGKQVCYGEPSHLQLLLELFDSELKSLSHRNPDGVHEGGDYYIFPISLILNAIAVLKCPEYLTYNRNWVEQAISLFHSLAPASKVSQITFLLYALDNLGLLNTYIPDTSAMFQACMEEYLQTTNGSGLDDYLRCTYLIHLAYQLGKPEMLHPRVFSILSESTVQTLGSQRYLESTYGSSYMAAAYALSAFDRSDRLDSLFNEHISLPTAIKRFNDHAEATAINSQKTVFSLIEVGLRMRAVECGDTQLFKSIQLS